MERYFVVFIVRLNFNFVSQVLATRYMHIYTKLSVKVQAVFMPALMMTMYVSKFISTIKTTKCLNYYAVFMFT